MISSQMKYIVEGKLLEIVRCGVVVLGICVEDAGSVSERLGCLGSVVITASKQLRGRRLQ